MGGPIAQLEEHVATDHNSVGSNPSWLLYKKTKNGVEQFGSSSGS